jgi:hypothetical protein
VSAAALPAPTSSSDPTVEAPLPGTPPPSGVYPPAGFPPMYERTAKPGDGAWQPVAYGAIGDRSVIHRTEVHPDKIKRHVFVTLIAFDRAAVELRLQAGTDEPSGDAVGPEGHTGLVPQNEHARLVAVFNGGFMARHGNYGMMLDGAVYVPPKEDACGVALGAGGEIVIGSWPAIEAQASSMRAWRQTPPCLVEAGAKNPALAGEMNSRKWGAAQGGDREIRRSAVALDAGGRTLFYAFGDWVTANLLADALHAAGAVAAAELDINWSYTRFFFIEHPAGAPPRIGESIVPKLEYSPNTYVTKPASRDFFYVVAKGIAAGAPP